MMPMPILVEPAHVADVRGWLEDQKLVVRALFDDCGAIACGAFILISVDPITHKELAVPKTKVCLLSDYDGSRAEFEAALRHWIDASQAIACVVFMEGVHQTVRAGLPGARDPVVCLLFQHRGRRPKALTARIVEDPTKTPSRSLAGDFAELTYDLSRGLMSNLFPQAN